MLLCMHENYYLWKYGRARQRLKVYGSRLPASIIVPFVQHHGGQISAISNPGTGTTFEVILPTSQT